MTQPFRLALLPLAAGVLILAGCGGSAASPPSPTLTVPTAAPVPTVKPQPTPVISGGDVAAVVNGHKIPMSTFRSLFTLTYVRSQGQPGVSPQALGAETMNEVIVQEIIRQYAAKHHITVSPKAVDQQVKQTQQQSGGAKLFQQQLSKYGMTLALYRQLVTTQLITQQIMQKVSPPSNKKEAVATVRHILIATHPQGKPARSDAAAKAKAEKILKELENGGNFAQLAKANSDDPGSAAQGGNLGQVYPGMTVPPFDRAVFHGPLHTYILVKSQYGYHIVEVLSRGKAAAPAQAQQQAQQVAFQKWLNQQMKHATIKRIATVKGKTATGGDNR